jgi:hypothetical protein
MVMEELQSDRVLLFTRYKNVFFNWGRRVVVRIHHFAYYYYQRGGFSVGKLFTVGFLAIFHTKGTNCNSCFVSGYK